MTNQRSDCIHRQGGEPVSSLSGQKHGSMVPCRLAVSRATEKSHLSTSDSLQTLNCLLCPVPSETACSWSSSVCGWCVVVHRGPPSGRGDQQDMCQQLLSFEMAAALACPESKVQNSLIVFYQMSWWRKQCGIRMTLIYVFMKIRRSRKSQTTTEN